MSFIKNLFCGSEIAQAKIQADLNNEILTKLKQEQTQTEYYKEQYMASQNDLLECSKHAAELAKENEFTLWLNDNYGSNWFVPYNKRFVPNHPNKAIPYHPSEFIYVSSVVKMLKLKTIQDIWTFRISYVTDQANENYNEFWQFPEETVALGCGDCEDSSIFRVSACRCIGIMNTAVALGFYKGQGHAFPVMLKDGKLYILEATTNNYYEVQADASKDYDIHWIFNEDGLWRAKPNAISFGELIEP